MTQTVYYYGRIVIGFNPNIILKCLRPTNLPSMPTFAYLHANLIQIPRLPTLETLFHCVFNPTFQ